MDSEARRNGSAPALEVRDLEVRYGAVRAVNGITLRVDSGEIVALLGANGAGKTSTINAISGVSECTVTGEVSLLGRQVTARGARHTLGREIALVPEGRGIVAPLSIEDNLLLGAYHVRSRRDRESALADVYELFPILKERCNGIAGLLSGGEQQMLAFGRAMMSRPKLILADEPSIGLAPVLVKRVMETIEKINSLGTSVLIVEQNAVAALQIASRGYVLSRGEVVKEGSAAVLLDDDEIADAFLGRRREGSVEK